MKDLAAAAAAAVVVKSFHHSSMVHVAPWLADVVWTSDSQKQ